MRPHNLGYTLLGVGLLWFGWFGFNAGSELAVDPTAALAFMNTQIATAAAAGAWIIVEKLRDGHATSLGVASGAVAGLVAITPACGFIDPWAAVLLGAIAGAICAYAVGLKYKLKYDDSLDVVGVHLVGGLLGAVSLGILSRYPVSGTKQGQGFLYGSHSFKQLGLQALAPVVIGLYSFIVAWIIGKIIDKTMGFRISEDDEVAGIDIAVHAESAYDLSPGHSGSGTLAAVTAASAADVAAAKVEADA
jgi:Amt family ammonium transporter